MSDSTATDDSDVKAGLRPRRRSLVWQFFEKVDRYRVRCLLCQHKQNYQGATGNILKHLKSKHQLNATTAGRKAPDYQARLRDLLNYLPYTISISIRKRLQDMAANDDVNTFENKEHFDNFSYVNDSDISEDSCGSSNLTSHTKKKGKRQLDEERVIAETECFREKAAFFELQKYLTALQAKKLRMEIEHLQGHT